MNNLQKVSGWARNVLALIGVLTLGYWLGGEKSVKAAGTGDLAFQLADVKEGSSLLVYDPSSKTVFVYQGANAGNSSVQCSFKYVVQSPGDTIKRVNCPVHSYQP